ncbi:MAG TPA: hypothetical protein VGM10_12370 [Actinocrinis sp.]|jgi:hypothetical protein
MALNRRDRGPRPAGPVRKTVEVIVSGAIGVGIVLLIVLLLRGNPGGVVPDSGPTAQPGASSADSPGRSRTLSPAPVGYPTSPGTVRSTPCSAQPCQSSAPATTTTGAAPATSNTPATGVPSTTPASTTPGLVGGAVGGVTGAVGGVAGAVGGLVGSLVGGVAGGN